MHYIRPHGGKWPFLFLVVSVLRTVGIPVELCVLPHTTVGIPVCGSTCIPQEFQQLFVTLSHTHTLLLVLLHTLYKCCHRDVSNVVNGEKSKEEFSL